MKPSDLAAWWRLRSIVKQPWAAVRLRKLRKGGVREVRFLDGRVARVQCNSPDALIFFRIFGRDEYHLRRFGPRSLGTVVDVGAHIGLFAIAAAPAAERIVSLEPVEGNFRLLQANIEASGIGNVKPVRACLAGEAGVVDIHVAGRNDAHSIYPKGQPARTEQVPAVTLASLFEEESIGRCSLLKLDCEGAEYDSLLGAPDELLARVDRIVMEYHPTGRAGHTPEALRRRLESAGFRVTADASKRTPGQGLMYCER